MERLKWFVQSPQCKRVGREASSRISVSCFGHQSLFHYLADSFHFLCQFWLIGGGCLELCFEDSVLCLGLLKKSVEIKRRKLQKVGEGKWLVVALPHHCCPLQLHALKSQTHPAQNTFSLGVEEIFLFPNVLNPVKGRLVRRRHSARIVYPGGLSSQGLDQCLGFFTAGFIKHPEELSFCIVDAL